MRIAQKLLSLVSNKDTAKRGERAAQATLTPAKQGGGRAHTLKCAVINGEDRGPGDAAKAERRAGGHGITLGLARGLVHKHGAAITDASRPPTGSSGQLKARYGEEWSANAAKMSQELKAKYAQSLERAASGPIGSRALNDAKARCSDQDLRGADDPAVFALGKQLAVAKAATDLRTAAAPESVPTRAYERLVSGNDAALQVRQAMIRAGLSPAEAQARMLKAAEQLKSGDSLDWRAILPTLNAQVRNEDTRVDVAVSEPMPELRQVNTQSAVRIDSNAAIAPARATTVESGGVEVAVAEPAPQLRQVNPQRAVRVNPRDVLAEWQALDDDLARRGAKAAVLPEQGATAALDGLDEALAGIANGTAPAPQAQQELGRPAGFAD